MDFLTVYQRPGRRSGVVYFLSVYCYLQRRYLLGIFSENSLIPEEEISGVEYFLKVRWYLNRRAPAWNIS